MVQLVFRVRTFAKGNCIMLRGCADEILAKNKGHVGHLSSSWIAVNHSG